MKNELYVYNTLNRKKELFEPLNPPYVGMYVCGPTVYSDVHIGNIRTFISFDIVYRYLTHLGYKVRYVRNITDVGHLTGDVDEGEDKIGRKARLENLEPMEIVQRYANDFHRITALYNLLPPSIEPWATGHIVEQIEQVKKLKEKGLAYEVNGSVYFDVEKYEKEHHYGKLSGRKTEDLEVNTRVLKGQSEKRGQLDFALWKKAEPEHIMRWPSPWGEGFPGWHLECTVMSTKYLGETFDIHGGGMDLQFPHHECETAQAVGITGKDPVKYWLHGNMLTVNGQKMSKSLDNSFLPDDLIKGTHGLSERKYSAGIVRYFMLQAHYRSTLDFSDDALFAAAKGYKKLINGLRNIKKTTYPESGEYSIDESLEAEIKKGVQACYAGMNDDFNTALTLAALSGLLKKINTFHHDQSLLSQISKEVFDELKSTFVVFCEDILGLKEENSSDPAALLETVMSFYSEAKAAKEYDKVDRIRAELKEEGIVLKDTKNGVDWAYEE